MKSMWLINRRISIAVLQHEEMCIQHYQSGPFHREEQTHASSIHERLERLKGYWNLGSYLRQKELIATICLISPNCLNIDFKFSFNSTKTNNPYALNRKPYTLDPEQSRLSSGTGLCLFLSSCIPLSLILSLIFET